MNAAARLYEQYQRDLKHLQETCPHEERSDWMRILLVVVTGLVVSLLHMPLLLVLVVFGGIGIVHEYLRSRKVSSA